jgi:predicted nucleic acid-binding protein
VLVLDTSAVLNVLTAPSPDPDLLARLESGRSLHAPHLIDVEFLNSLRRLARVDRVVAERADEIRDDFGRLRLQRYPHGGFANRIWELRHNVSAYDAAYIALAEALACPLVTSDARMAKASGHRADVEVYEQP